MVPLRMMTVLMAAALLTACVGGSATVQQRQPEDLHRSIRYLNSGTSFYHKGCYTHAAYQFQKAHEMFTAADDLQGAADSLNSLANAYYRLDDMHSAVIVYDEAADYYQLLGDRRGRVRALSNKSVALAFAGKFSPAASALDKADTIAGGDDLLAGLRLKARAILELKTDDAKQAKELMRKALRSTSKRDPGHYASMQYTMGYTLLSAGEPQDAIPYLKRALAVDREERAYFSIAQDLETLGDCHVALEQHAQAVHYYRRCIKIYALLERTERVAGIKTRLSKSAAMAKTDVTATLHWVQQWSDGRWELNICR